MWHVVVWLLAAVFLSLWSLVAWAVHAAANWVAALAGAHASVVAEGATVVTTQAAEFRLPEWLAVWLPPGVQEQFGAIASALIPWVASVMSDAPSLIAWLTPAIWVLWAVGCLLLLAVCAGLSAFMFANKRRRSAY